MDLSKSTNNNIEWQGQEFLTYSLTPWLKRWEEQINMKLILPQDRSEVYVEHKVDALLRGDYQTRMAGHQTSLMYGIRTINQVRALENENGIGPAGDVHFFPANMATVETIIEGPPPQTGFGRPMNQERDETPPPPTEEGTSDAPSPGEALNLTAAHLLLRDTISRLLRKEANEASRVIEGKKDFDAWVESFYQKHGATIRAALAPLASAIRQLGFGFDAELVANRLAADSVHELRHLYDTATPEAMRKALDGWAVRADKAALDILKGGGK
jgi:hypothetical protein